LQLTPQFGNKRLHQNSKRSPKKTKQTDNPQPIHNATVLDKNQGEDFCPWTQSRTLIADLKPQTRHNSMLVKNHILLFMLEDQPSIPAPPMPFPISALLLLLLLLLLHTSRLVKWAHLINYQRIFTHAHNGKMVTWPWCWEFHQKYCWVVVVFILTVSQRKKNSLTYSSGTFFILVNHSRCYLISGEATRFIDSGESRWLRPSGRGGNKTKQKKIQNILYTQSPLGGVLCEGWCTIFFLLLWETCATLA